MQKRYRGKHRWESLHWAEAQCKLSSTVHIQFGGNQKKPLLFARWLSISVVAFCFFCFFSPRIPSQPTQGSRPNFDHGASRTLRRVRASAFIWRISPEIDPHRDSSKSTATVSGSDTAGKTAARSSFDDVWASREAWPSRQRRRHDSGTLLSSVPREQNRSNHLKRSHFRRWATKAVVETGFPFFLFFFFLPQKTQPRRFDGGLHPWSKTAK